MNCVYCGRAAGHEPWCQAPKGTSIVSSDMAMPKLGFELRTKLFENAIEQEMVQHDGCGGVETVFRTMLNLQETEIRNALIKLGWTPPTDMNEVERG